MTHLPTITLSPLPGIPHVEPGDDVAALLLAAVGEAGLSLASGDLLVVAQKIVSKAEGRAVQLSAVQPRAEAHRVAEQTGKDPRLVELILSESESISRLAPNLLITRHRLGFTSANAGIDRSNVHQDDDADTTLLLLPLDPDGSAERLRAAILQATGIAVGVVISDSHGRPFRLGTTGVAIGVAGMPALWNRRGEPDLYGFDLRHTEVGIADEVAAAASLIMGQAAEGIPAVHVRGLELPDVDGRARDLVRPAEMDLYR